MDLANIVLSIAVPVAILLVALALRPSLSSRIWRGFLKLAKANALNYPAEQQKDPPQKKRTEQGQKTER
jgi:hypothetical protein